MRGATRLSIVREKLPQLQVRPGAAGFTTSGDQQTPSPVSVDAETSEEAHIGVKHLELGAVMVRKKQTVGQSSNHGIGGCDQVRKTRVAKVAELTL